MTAVLTVLSGARAGTRHRLSGDFATLGRHSSSDLRLDREADLDVSARHAAVFRQGPAWVVRDLGSTNGTWVNGTRVRGDRALDSGDRIRLGTRGPEVEFALVESDVLPRTLAERPPDVPAVEVVPAASEFTPVDLPAPDYVPSDDLDSTDLRIRMEVARQTDRLRRRIFALIGVVLLAAAGIAGLALWNVGRVREDRVEERTQLLAQLDSLQRHLTGAAEQTSALEQALDSARAETAILRRSMATAAGPARLERLDSLVADAIDRHTPLLRAAGFDAGAIEERESASVGMVFVQYANGQSVSATGFVGRAAGDTGWIVTTRHAVLDQAGAPPSRLGASLSRRSDVYRGRLAAVDDSLDIAVVRVISRVGFRPVRDLADQPARPGDPVALIGYPLGTDLPMGGNWATPTTTIATVSRILPDLIQLDGYGVSGASGSPVFNSAGEVTGMLYGGEPETGGRIVYAVPAARIRALLDRATKTNRTED